VGKKGRERACVFGAWVVCAWRVLVGRMYLGQASQRSASLTRRDKFLDATESREEKEEH